MENVVKQRDKDKRTGVACETCRKRKRKCDGLRPVCTLCITIQKDCQYSGTTETRKRKQPDNEYVSMLENQVSNLKSYVQKLELSLQGQNIPSLQSTGRVSEDITDIEQFPLTKEHFEATDLDPTPINTARDDSRIGSELCSEAVEEVSALIWRMNIGDVGEPAFTGPSGNFCFPSSNTTASRPYKIGPLPYAMPAVNPKLAQYSHDSAVKQSLLNLFITQVNPFHKFVNGVESFQVELFPTNDQNQNLLFSAIFAAGASYSKDATEKQAGDTFAANADSIAVQSCRSSPSIVCVQALSILAWRELSQEHNNIAWIYNSMAGGLAVALGLPAMGLRDLFDYTYLPERRDARIKTFWSFFLVDRIATSILGRNCSVPWRRIEVPGLDTILGSSPNIDDLAFSSQCKLWYLHDQYMDQIYAFEFRSLEPIQRNRLHILAHDAILNFRAALPQRLKVAASQKLSSPPHPSVIFLQMSYEMSLLLIHRPFLREPPTSNSFQLASGTMTVAAANMARYIQIFQKLNTKNFSHEPSQPERALIPPYFLVHHVLTASIMHLLNGTSENVQHKKQARRKLQICMDFLATLQATWTSATKAIIQIQELACRWKIVAVLPIHFSNVSMISSERHSARHGPMQTLEEEGMGQDQISAHSPLSHQSYNTNLPLDLNQDFGPDFVDYQSLDLDTALQDLPGDMAFGVSSPSGDENSPTNAPISFDLDQHAIHDMYEFIGIDI
ncbi:hypothetical protein BGZ60DRAFT_424054 [Tricladium varicosporioides]|nr:hypothetical protein BGZ60DRAFT_424054 [Hymenoscyphus varicosporioides]